MRVSQRTIGEENREQIYVFIVKYIAEKCYPPSHKEISKGVGLSETTVKRHVKYLIEDKLLETDSEPGEDRAFRVAGTKVVKKGRIQ